MRWGACHEAFELSQPVSRKEVSELELLYDKGRMECVVGEKLFTVIFGAAGSTNEMLRLWVGSCRM